MFIKFMNIVMFIQFPALPFASQAILPFTFTTL